MSELNNLVALTKLHISQHYDEKAWVFTDPETFSYYRSFAQASKEPQRQQKLDKPQPVQPRKPLPAPKPAAPKPVAKKSASPTLVKPPESIERVAPKPADEVDFSDLFKIMKTHFPGQKVLEGQPDDKRAKEIAHKWKHPTVPPEIWILDSSRTPVEKLLLENIARAIECYFYPAAVLAAPEIDNEQTPRLVLGTKDLLKEVKTPSIEMEPISSYLESPQEKGRLWKELKSTLQSS